jgi:hypothetical protein
LSIPLLNRCVFGQTLTRHTTKRNLLRQEKTAKEITRIQESASLTELFATFSSMVRALFCTALADTRCFGD